MVASEHPVPSSTRIIEASATIRHWRGRIDDLVDAARLAIHELCDVDYTPSTRVNVGYHDGQQAWASLDDFRQEASRLTLSDITYVAVNVGGDRSRVSILIWAGTDTGISVKAQGVRAALVNGVNQLVVDRLRSGEQPGVLPKKRARSIEEIVRLVLAVLIAVVGVAVGGLLDVGPLSMRLLVGLVVGSLAMMIAPHASREIEAPGMDLVRSEDRPAPEPAGKRGPVWRLKAWLVQHPVISFFAGAAVALGINVLAGLMID